MKRHRILPKLLLPVCAMLATCGAAQAAVDEFGKPIVYVSSAITGPETWYATNSYYLRSIIYVETNATLVIEPGTVVKGVSDTNSVIATPDIPNLVSGLWVTRGGKLYATGTVTKPIIFTFDGDDLTKANDVGTNVSGMWGGIVLLGNATINSAANATGNAATPKFEVFEGTTGGTANSKHIFGGDNDADSSGALRYVSIRYPGSKFEPAKELNGLTMGGCGYNTTVEYVEVLNSQDDGFEWWGGVMNTKHLVAAFCEDDDFDTDQGYRGTNQFWFGIKPTWNLTSSTDSRGFETDGELNDSVNATFKAPASEWAVYNATLIGRGYGDTTAGGGRCWNARDETMAKVYNTIFTSFSQGVLVDADETATYFGDGRAVLQNAIVDVSSNVYSANVSVVLSDVLRTNSAVPALLKSISYTANGELDPRPQAGSPALNDVLPGAPEAVTYRGAFGPNDTWIDGWTALSSLGYVPTAGPKDEFGKPIVYVSSAITGQETWYATNSYYLRSIIYVETNATLVIEPGTVVKGVSDTNSVIATPDIPNLVSGLWVARGGKLYATGTVTKPIIFTFDGDDLTKANDVGTNVSGMWGGIVLLGNATINSAANATGNAATPKFEVFEGTTGGTANSKHIFGGDNDADSSGALRYVSIRYPGSKFEPAKELNGLTMGGCGYNTAVEYVEVLNSQDDGFEWWGGVMNTKYLVAAFCEDDDFDTDQGYRGTNQFWFGIKPTWNLTSSTDSRGFETDGELNDSVNGTFKAPASAWAVYNATLIGRGFGDTTAGGGRCWNARDETMAKVYNTIFTSFSQGVLVDADETATYFGDGRAVLQNAIVDVSSNVYSANVSAALSDVLRTNSAVPALLKSISYTANGELDPRPQAGSPALSDVLPGAPEAVTYRGAFGPNDTWANGWTALSQVGYLNTNVVVNPPQPPSISPSYSGGQLTFSLTSQNGHNYTLQSTPQLNPAAWTNVATLPGNGQVISFAPVATTNANEFFRILAE